MLKLLQMHSGMCIFDSFCARVCLCMTLSPFRYVWYAVIAFACLAVIAACLTIDYGEYLTDDVTRKLHGRTVEVGEQSGDAPEIDKEKNPAIAGDAVASCNVLHTGLYQVVEYIYRGHHTG